MSAKNKIIKMQNVVGILRQNVKSSELVCATKKSLVKWFRHCQCSWVCRSKMWCNALNVEVEKKCRVAAGSPKEPRFPWKQFLAVCPNARVLGRDLKCTRQPDTIWLCNRSFCMLKDLFFFLIWIKICHWTSLATCLTGNKGIGAISASGRPGAAVQVSNISQ